MQRAWTPPVRYVFAAATLLGFFSTLQTYRLSTLEVNASMSVPVWRILVANLTYWYVPAALTSTIFRIAYRFPLDAPGWPRSLAVHALAAVGFSIVHVAAMIGLRTLLNPTYISTMTFSSWTSWIQRAYLTNLDWALMTYSAVVGLSYALAYNRESRARALRAAHLEARLAEARLKTLEAKLHPHFLFNTLHAISTLVHTQPDAADRMNRIARNTASNRRTILICPSVKKPPPRFEARPGPRPIWFFVT